MRRIPRWVVQAGMGLSGLALAGASWAFDCPAGADPTYCKLAEATGGKVVQCPKTPQDALEKCMAETMAQALSKDKTEDAVAARYAQAAAKPGAEDAQACRKILNGFRVNAPRDRRVQNVLKKHLRWGGTAHNPLPHPHATYEDIVAAKAALSPADIPMLVHLAGTGKLGSGAKGLAFGVLQQFGPAALPCIDAATSMGIGGGELGAVRTSIEIAHNLPRP